MDGCGFEPRTSTNAYRHVCMIEKARLPCRPLCSQHVQHQRWIWGIHCAQATKQSSEGSTLALKPSISGGASGCTDRVKVKRSPDCAVYICTATIVHLTFLVKRSRFKFCSAIILSLLAKMYQSRQSLLIARWVHERILTSTFRRLAPKKWYGKPVTMDCAVYTCAVTVAHV